MTEREQFLADRRDELEQLEAMYNDLVKGYPDEEARRRVLYKMIRDVRDDIEVAKNSVAADGFFIDPQKQAKYGELVLRMEYAHEKAKALGNEANRYYRERNELRGELEKIIGTEFNLPT